jgi:hypothetical protein
MCEAPLNGVGPAKKPPGTLRIFEGYGVGNPRGFVSGRTQELLKFQSLKLKETHRKTATITVSVMVTSDRPFHRANAQVNRQFTEFTCSLSWEFSR